MTLAEIENHREVSDRFLQDARYEFERGDLLQASEKAWGAVAHYLKSEAKFRGWRNETHRDLADIANDLALETSDPERANELFVMVSFARVNFYEDSYGARQVAVSIDAADELISRLENRTGPEILDPRPSQIERENRPRPRRRRAR